MRTGHWLFLVLGVAPGSGAGVCTRWVSLGPRWLPGYLPFLGGGFGVIFAECFGLGVCVMFCVLLLFVCVWAVVDQLPRLGKVGSSVCLEWATLFYCGTP